MARQNTTARSLVRRLRPSAERFAAAAALQDPNLLLQLQAARSHDERPTGRRRTGRSAFRGAASGEQGAALLLATTPCVAQ
jgi:hypothetical protein